MKNFKNFDLLFDKFLTFFLTNLAFQFSHPFQPSKNVLNSEIQNFLTICLISFVAWLPLWTNQKELSPLDIVFNHLLLPKDLLWSSIFTQKNITWDQSNSPMMHGERWNRDFFDSHNSVTKSSKKAFVEKSPRCDVMKMLFFFFNNSHLF